MLHLTWWAQKSLNTRNYTRGHCFSLLSRFNTSCLRYALHIYILYLRHRFINSRATHRSVVWHISIKSTNAHYLHRLDCAQKPKMLRKKYVPSVFESVGVWQFAFEISCAAKLKSRSLIPFRSAGVLRFLFRVLDDSAAFSELFLVESFG